MIEISDALEYHSHGYNVLPLPERSKKPSEGNNWRQWINHPQTSQDIQEMFESAVGNLAVIGGVRSAHTTAGFPYFLDVDDLGAFKEIKAEIIRDVGETWVSRSKRGGAIWCKSTQPVKSQKLLLSGRPVGEIRGVGNYIVAPPSIHPSGMMYEFEFKPEHIALADALPFTQLEFRCDNDHSSLPRIVNRILAGDLDQLTKYHSRSECDFALIVSLVNRSADMHLIQSILDKSPYSHYRDLKPANKITWLKRAIAKARSQNESEQYTCAVNKARAYRQWANTTAPALITHARTGVTDKSALLAHIAISAKSGRLQYHLSAREGAELASMHRETFTKATSRLVAAGRIKKLQDGVMSLACRYELVLLPSTPILPNVCEWSVEEHTRQQGTYGVFEHAGLGRQVGDTWQWLLRGYKSIEDVVNHSGKAFKTVKNHIRVLSQFDLVIKKGNCWIASTEGIEALGRRLGTHDLAAKRQAVHQRERFKFRTLLNHTLKARKAKNSKETNTAEGPD